MGDALHIKTAIPLRLLTAAVLAAGLLTATGAPAHAATPKFSNGIGYVAGTYLQDWDIEYDQVSVVPVYNPGPNQTWKCSMFPGLMSHRGVGVLQDTLNFCYYPMVISTRLTVDGSFGPKTKAALIKVQQSRHITADGIYGPQTAGSISHKSYRSRGTQLPPEWDCGRLGIVVMG